MTFLPARLPAPLSGRLASASNAILGRAGREVDLAIGGIPFRLATAQDTPQSIETITVRKDQFDTEQDPGEQSLSSWWRRSQASFHEGAGLTYQEDSEGKASNGFFDSEGVDVFTQGQISLLRAMSHDDALSPVATLGRIRHSYASATDSFADTAVGGSFRIGSAGSTMSALHAPVGKTIVDGMLAYPNVYDVASDGTLYTGTVDSTLSTYTASHTYTLTGGKGSRLGWGKFRLWVIGGNSIFQPDISAANGSQSAHFANPDTGWTYTCMAEGPGAMYFGGHNGIDSAIQAITVDSDGTDLSGAAVTASLPQGELVQELSILGGTYFGIGTTRGFRVGVIDVDTGAISYGPLLFEPEGVVRCTAITTQGRFFVVAFQSQEGPVAYRVDTSLQLDSNVYPYAKDIRCGLGGYINSLAVSGDSLIATTSDGFSWQQSSSTYVSTGWLQSGRIRYRTTEKKVFKFLALEIEPLQGTLQAQLVLEGGSTSDLGSLTNQNDIFDGQFGINLEPMRYASIRLTLNSTGDGQGSPVLNSYLLKAMPSIAPQRMITLPLLCYDREQSLTGQEYGGVGYAADRIQALQLIEDAGDTVSYQDFSSGSSEGTQVLVESIKVEQFSPPRDGSVGGIVTLQLRTMGS